MPPTPASPSIDARARALRPPALGAWLRAAWPFLACVLVAVAFQLAVKPLISRYLDDFYAKLLLDIGTNIILAVSLTVVNGFTGQFSIGHAAFMAVGAYTAAEVVYYGSYRLWGDAVMHAGILSGMSPREASGLIQWGDLLFLGSLLAGGLVSAACGYLVGLPSLRLRGDYLAIVTLGFGEIVRVLLQQTRDALYDADEISRRHFLWIKDFFSADNWREYFNSGFDPARTTWESPLAVHVGGPLGFIGLPFYASLFWSTLFAGVTLLVAYRLKVSSYGRAFLSIREDEVAAEAMGIHTTRYKVRAFVIAAFFAGIAGGIYAHTLGVQVNPAELGFQKSFDIIIMVVLGGMGSISGAAIAAVILTLLPELLRAPPTLFHPVGLGYIYVVGVVGAAICLAVFARRKLRSLLWLAVAVAAWEIVRSVAIANGVNLSEYRMVLYSVALILMMILRPQGLLGLRELWELGRSAKRLRPRPHSAAVGESGRAGGKATL